MKVEVAVCIFLADILAGVLFEFVNELVYSSYIRNNRYLMNDKVLAVELLWLRIEIEGFYLLIPL